MPNLSVVLAATITVSDTTLSPSPTIVSRSLNNPTLAAIVDFANNFFQVTGATVVNLPAPTVWIVYVKNLDVAANLTVTYTPVGGVASSMLLVPGGIFLYFQPTEAAGGITALTLTPSAGTIAADVYVAK
jgi:hypothetical protein